MNTDMTSLSHLFYICESGGKLVAKGEGKEPEGISLLLILIWEASKHNTTENPLCFFCST